MLANHVEGNSNRTYLALWALIMFYAAATILPLFPGAVPFPIVVASEIIPAAIFALVHGAKLYRLRSIFVFAGLCLLIGNILENIGVLTGFPFGRYYFTERMGPKLFQVPVLIGPAYLGVGYLSWVVARLILGKAEDLFAGARVVTVPIMATFMMAAWDLAIDPTLSTIGHYWIWLKGGPYFGVPLVNFLGWYLTNYLIYQSFALYLRSRPAIQTRVAPVYWRLAVLFYTVVAVGNVLRIIPVSGPTTVIDAAGVQWKVADINAACALAALFVMGAFAWLGWAKVADQEASVGSPETPQTAKKTAAG